MINYNEICDEILKINPSIRYTGIYYQDEFHYKSREGLKTLLSDEESKRSIMEAVRRWETDQYLTSKLGSSIYSLTKFENVNRFTFPIGGEGLILVSSEIDLDPNLITDKILETKRKHFS